MLNVFSTQCIAWKLNKTTQKTKIVILSKGIFPNIFRLFINNNEIEIVKNKKHLVLFMTEVEPF